ncbi:fatty acid desaturase [Oleiharenicola lentus]|uniref:fatty acid desaturase n=1 Tax=Oleiharenicola lentus TaxID=2508720 RepID=UPI003F666367
MESPNPLLTTEQPLPVFTERVRKGEQITWYRSPLPPGAFKRLHERSDFRATVQTVGYLAILATTFALAWWSVGRVPWWGTVGFIFLHGMMSSFLINGVHELGHGTVFKTKKWNDIFCHVLAFLGWINHEVFQASHVRHHRYTLHPPEDLEVVLPVRLMLRDFFFQGFFSWKDFKFNVAQALRLSFGKFKGEWELTLFPEGDPKRKAPVRWARTLLIGHSLIIVAGVLSGHWILPVLLTFGPFYGGWLFWLCNNTQHIGLCDNVSDFRLCTRSFTLNPVVRFVYWQMNYHIEHHMYAAVPCYNLSELHKLIEADLPPTPKGILGVWREIARILRRQEKEPAYQYSPVLPNTVTVAR